MKRETEQWDFVEPRPGAQLRVSRGAYYHHGICVGEDAVIHFGGGNDVFHPEQNTVCRTDMAGFLQGGLPEVRVYSRREKRRLRAPAAIVAAAESHLGEGGYDFLHNNCEHFSNLCAFGEAYSAQADAFRARVGETLGKRGDTV